MMMPSKLLASQVLDCGCLESVVAALYGASQSNGNWRITLDQSPDSVVEKHQNVDRRSRVQVRARMSRRVDKYELQKGPFASL